MKKIKQRLAENLSRFRFNWWRYQPARSKHFKHFSVVFCLCEMCHQNRRSPPSLTPSDFDGWCDECFVDLPDWLRHKKTTAEELARLAKKEKDEAEKRRLEREERARVQDTRKMKKVKLTGFENVENEEELEEERDKEEVILEEMFEKEVQELNSIYHYSKED